jgi:probable rRNA maturation factor
VAVELRCETSRGRSYARKLRDDALNLVRFEGLEGYELSLMLVGDRSIRRLNRDFRKKDEPTDVLSFPQIEAGAGLIKGRRSRLADGGPGALLGDVVISVDTARRQAREMSVSLSARLRTLLIHGFLHLLGYDHERSAVEARRMFARECELAGRLSGGGGGGRAASAPPGKRSWRRGGAL